MFGFFKNKKSNNPVSEAFIDLSIDQKMSIMNLLTLVAFCDKDQGNIETEVEFLNNYVSILGVNSSLCMKYYEEKGQKQMFDDLKILSRFQKELLTITSFELINCDGRPNETELTITPILFENIGVSDSEYVATIDKSQILIKHFNQ